MTPGATVVFRGAIAREVMVFEDGKNCPQPAASRRRETEATTGKSLGRSTFLSYHWRAGRVGEGGLAEGKLSGLGVSDSHALVC